MKNEIDQAAKVESFGEISNQNSDVGTTIYTAFPSIGAPILMKRIDIAVIENRLADSVSKFVHLADSNLCN